MFWDITYEHAWYNIYKSNMALRILEKQASISEVTLNYWLKNYSRYKIYVKQVILKQNLVLI